MRKTQVLLYGMLCGVCVGVQSSCLRTTPHTANSVTSRRHRDDTSHTTAVRRRRTTASIGGFGGWLLAGIARAGPDDVCRVTHQQSIFANNTAARGKKRQRVRAKSGVTKNEKQTQRNIPSSYEACAWCVLHYSLVA